MFYKIGPLKKIKKSHHMREAHVMRLIFIKTVYKRIFKTEFYEMLVWHLVLKLHFFKI